MVTISETLRTLREKHGETQEELADALGVSRPMIVQIERGSKVPGLFLAIDIARRYHVTVEQLAGLFPIPENKEEINHE